MPKTTIRTISMYADADSFGPWVGVPDENKSVCAFTDCTHRGSPQVCFYDTRYHHHGCIHYDRDDRMRKGWCYVCDDHYALLKAERDERVAARSAT